MSIKKIQDRLKDLYQNKRKELAELLEPDPIRCHAPRNLVTDFPGFLDWLKKMDRAAMTHIEAELRAHRDHALKREIEKYTKRKKHYEEQVNAKLGRIGGFEVGVAVFAEIRRSRKLGYFHPFIVKNKVDADVGSYDVDKATSTGMPIYDKNYAVTGSGLGTGSDVYIDYSADLFGVFNNAPRRISVSHGPGSEADEVLMHELVHASRQLNGLRHRMPVSGGYDNEEEYLAVVIANIYLSNKTKTQFRKNHHGHDILPDPMNFLDSTAANLAPRVLLERLRLHQPTFYNALAAIPKEKTPFNPVRWYEHERTAKQAA